nr:putative ABC transporter permease [uncultured Blautia sp.]
MLNVIHNQNSKKFAQGCGFYKLFWIFMIGAFIGDFLETYFCLIVTGTWMNRSSVVWGNLSIIWGGALVLATISLYSIREKSCRYIFLIGTLLGGIYEYLCSLFTELIFGRTFWDYDKIPFNINGRTNLLYCFFWGIVAVIWIKMIYPTLSKCIEKISVLLGTCMTWLLIIFLITNITISSLALIRYNTRNAGLSATKRWEKEMDKFFDNQTIEKIYPNIQ